MRQVVIIYVIATIVAVFSLFYIDHQIDLMLRGVKPQIVLQ